MTLLLGLAACPAPVGAQAPIVELRVEGNARLSSERVVTASGLKQGAVVTREDLDAAAKRLFDTGFFRSVNYAYQPRPGGGAGFVVTLRVEEERATVPVQLDLPGIDETQFWQALRSAGGLVEKTMPDTAGAAEYYQRAIEAALGPSSDLTPITMKTEVDFTTGTAAAIFRPANVPVVSEIQFEGNRQIPTPALEAAISGLLVGRDFSERDARRVVDLNARPLYEEKALLTVKFPSVKATRIGEGAVSVTAVVEEGLIWTLGNVEIVGDDLPLAEMRGAAKFPEGKPANWKQVTAGIASLEDVLKRSGYLEVSSIPQRDFRVDAGLVDLTVRVSKGKQFSFGALRLEGLGPAAEREARALWKLREGDPMNVPYIEDFLRLALKGPAGGAKSVASELGVRPGSTVVDLVISFK